MRIEGNNDAQKQDLPITPAVVGGSQPRPAEAGAVPDSTDLSSVGKSLLQNAAAYENVNRTAVAETRKLLQDGLLDTPEAARRAAEILIDRGP